MPLTRVTLAHILALLPPAFEVDRSIRIDSIYSLHPTISFRSQEDTYIESTDYVVPVVLEPRQAEYRVIPTAYILLASAETKGYLSGQATPTACIVATSFLKSTVHL
ncbi:hypothetical protein K435DRAFT_939161 [Dendrothele bispora CBS 962.96]|uniref:Uncharacterized protein n=1 Tax=Dendrothele bispora (strain CBS 962.96) TaxID=1314807 RepID=A0A4V4HBV1_DENBC|nr:hypothetical protein K435DRAFT_939161 [Dendrothele bispora CBS 962.96]